MKKRIISIFLCMFIIFAYTNILTGCETVKKPLKIIFLGDSIAEGILGPSPITERERYAYYGILGLRNNYEYNNRAVSGQQSSDMLALIQKEDEGAAMTQTLIRDADVIHISILGNDLLLTDIGQLILSAADNDFSIIDEILITSRIKFAAIVSTIREYNPDAVLMFQNVYNPVNEDSALIYDSIRQTLAGKDIEPDGYRELGAALISRLNGVINDYLVENPDAFYLIDSFSEFDRIYEIDYDLGEKLIIADGIHPSNYGHAVLADLIQKKLEVLSLADKNIAVKDYKTLRQEQLVRMFSENVDTEKYITNINSASTCEEITDIYFGAISGVLPDYY